MSPGKQWILFKALVDEFLQLLILVLSGFFLLFGQPLGSLEGCLAKMLNRLFPIPIFRPGDTGHLFAKGVNLAGAAGSIGLVACPADLGENLGNSLGH